MALYQDKEVDYLVATDAIGMGLNMDVNHVGFAGLGKFDGARPRRLTAAEVAQIAGRAGRGMRDGTFGTPALRNSRNSFSAALRLLSAALRRAEQRHLPSSRTMATPNPSGRSAAGLFACARCAPMKLTLVPDQHL